MITEEKKHEYWNHFVARMFVEGPKYPKVTGPRLRKIKPVIWKDKDFWGDILVRHDGMHNPPEHLAKHRPADYGHCKGNFWGMIHQTLVERGLI